MTLKNAKELMQRVERHIFTNRKDLEEICYKAKLLYNFCNYHMRHVYFGEIQSFNEFGLMSLLAEFNQEDYRRLPAKVGQQIIKLLFRNWKSFLRATKEYKKNPSKFKGKPQIPRYKKDQFIVPFTYQSIQTESGQIVFPKKSELPPLKTKVTNIKQVRIIPQATCHVIEVVYEKKQQKADINKDNFLSIDIGLNNLAACISNVGQPFIVNGRPLKSVNHYFNKSKAKLQSFVGDKGTSNRIKSLTHKRNCKVNDYLHKTSRIVIDYCLEHKIGVIVIGKNDGWKQRINIGKRNNQNFVSIPHAKLIEQIQYKGEDVGIEVMVQEEGYTSKCDALVLEAIEKHEKYSGKRIRRGLFKSGSGNLINADINGAINIARKSKVFRNAQIQEILDIGVADTPIMRNIAA